MKKRLAPTLFAAVAGVSLVGSVAACNLLPGGSVETVDVGACIDSSQLGEEITDIPTVDCTESHDTQVVGKFDLEDGDFPGNDAITAAATEQCSQLFEDFIGAAWEDSGIANLQWITPTEGTWDQANDREVICLATDDTPATESWENSGGI